MMFILRIFILFLISITIGWIFIQLVLFDTCFTDNHVSSSSQVHCQKEQTFLFLRIFELAEHEPHCIKVLSAMKDTLSSNDLPTIYVVTPTYTRPVQKAELTRLSYTFLLVPKIHWIVIEDAANKTQLVTNFLAQSRLKYTHLNVPTPEPLKTNVEDPNWLKPRGVLQRNKALSWMRQHLSMNDRGVVYFADDDNTYDLELFDEMRFTKTVSVWPVALVGGLMVEKPLVENGKVVGWNTLWKTDRPFPIDMAGFAVNLTLLLQHKTAAFSARVPRGYQESKLLKEMVSINELEPKANNCTKVLVWHTRTERVKLKQEKKLTVPSNVGMEV